MSEETINSVFEGLISLVVIVGAGYLVGTHPDSTAMVGFAAGGASAVITFWFGQRQATKAVNGNITALSSIAGQVNESHNQATQATADALLTAMKQTDGG